MESSQPPQLYELIGIVKAVRPLSQERDATRLMTIMSTTSQREFEVYCTFFCPVRRGDVIAGYCIKGEKEQYLFLRCPVVELPSSREAIQTSFTIAFGKLRVSKWMLDRVYDFFKQETLERIAQIDKSRSMTVAESSIYRNKDMLNAAVMEMISWYSFTFRTQPEIVTPLVNLGLSRDQAQKLLRWWHREQILRRLYLLGLTKKEIKECCERGWVNGASVATWENSPSALYYQLLENPYLVEKLPMVKAHEISQRYGLSFNQNMIECADLVRFVDIQSQENGWACYPIYTLLRRYPRFNELQETLKRQYKCEIRYNFLYLRHQAIIEDTLLELLQNKEVSTKTFASERTKKRLCEEQIYAVENALNNTVSIVTGGAGTGKCLAPETPVLMANGEIKMAKDVRAGDQLMGDDSTPRLVYTTCTGEDNMYRIVPDKGRSFVCNEPHVLTLKGIVPHIEFRSNHSLKYNVRYSVRGDIKNKAFMTQAEADAFIVSLGEDVFDIPLNEYLKKPDRFKRYTYLFHTGVNFTEQPVPFDPYIIGLWLGDDTSKAAQITNVDLPILAYLEQKLPEYGLQLEAVRPGDNTYNVVGVGENKFARTLKDLKMWGNKHIPSIYKINSRENRLKLLAGLIDSDGYRRDNYIEISQKSDQLADDIEYLAFSLGFMVTRTECVKSCMYQGEKREGIYNRINIFGDGLEEIPVLLDRKKCEPRQQTKRANCVSFRVEPVGVGQYCGFQISGNGRFLLGDFLVTHNTTVIRAIGDELELRGISYCILSFTGKAVARVKEVVGKTANIMTLHMFLARSFAAPFEYVIFDEISMVPNELMAKVLLKLSVSQPEGRRLKVVMVGDPNQVQPIEWGDLFNQLLSIGPVNDRYVIPWTHLQEDHRRASRGGALYRNTQQFAQSFTQSLIGDKIDIIFEWGDDCQFVQGQLPELEALVSSLHQTRIDHRQITIVAPYKDLDDVNAICERIFINPRAPSVVDSFGKTWRVGARVMMTEKNFYEIGVMNGDEGIVVEVNQQRMYVRVVFRNGKDVNIPTFLPVVSSEYEDTEKEEPLSTKFLVLAWAVTIHKSQGSEWEHVIFFVRAGRSASGFFNKKLLYTGISRSKISLYVVANSKTSFESAIYVDPPVRYDNLAKRFRGEPFVGYYVDPAQEKMRQLLAGK